METRRAKVIMLPTTDKSNVILDVSIAANKDLIYLNNIKKAELKGNQNQHLYITTDDEIKEGDWCVITNKTGTKFIAKNNGSNYKLSTGGYVNCSGESKKIIATTDKSLSNCYCSKCKGSGNKVSKKPLLGNCLKCGGRGIIINTLPQPSKAFIEKYCKVSGIDEVMIEYESKYNIRRKQNPNFIGDALSEDRIKNILKVNSHNEITIYPIKNSWNREEVSNLIKKYALEEHIISSTSDILNIWIKENL